MAPDTQPNPVSELYRACVRTGIAPARRAVDEALAKCQRGPLSSLTGSFRTEFGREFGFALPDAESIKIIAPHGPILEVGAGSGLWSRFLQEAGVDAIAVDDGSCSYGIQDDGSHKTLALGTFHPVLRMDAVSAMAAYPERTVLMVWPDSRTEMAERAARDLAVGRTLIVVGESGLGCTGTPAFERRLESDYRLAHRHLGPTWDVFHDEMRIFTKLREPAPEFSPR